MKYNPTLIIFIILIILLVIWRFWKKIVTYRISTLNNISYPLKSSLVFIGFQILLFPAMVISDGLGFRVINKAIAYIGSIQAYVIPTMFNLLFYGKRYPARIELWLLVGIFLHAIGGLLLGLLLQNRTRNFRKGFLLLGSLILFETMLTILLVSTVKSDLWLEVWRLHPGPREW